MPRGAKVAAPTAEQFTAYQQLYDYFNRALFAGELPSVILNFSRRAHSYGFFAPERWHRGDTRTHEISLNPAHLQTRPSREVLSTLVHEMVHLWQHAYGEPSRRGYHNRQWADKMLAVGLHPSDTGEPGGRLVGQHMTHYIVEGGPFAKAFDRMPTQYNLPWQGIPEPERRAPSPGPGGGPSPGPVVSPKNKIKYSCPNGHGNAWGKPELSLICGVCSAPYLPEGAELPIAPAPGEPGKGPAGEPPARCDPEAPACSLGLMGGVCGVPAQLLLASPSGAPVPKLARYCLTSASRLVPSHDPLKLTPQGGLSVRSDYPAGVQERAYDRDKSEAQKVLQIGANLWPELIANSNPDGINGPPVVTQRDEDRRTGRAIVLGGNGRSMGTQRHYADGGTALKEYLIRNARTFGFTPAQVRAISDPVVVRVVETSGQPAELRELVRLLNVGLMEELATKARSSAEAARLSDESIEILTQALTEDQSLSDFLSSSQASSFAAALQRAGILTKSNRKNLVEADGSFSRDGKTFIERLLVASVIQDAATLDKMPDGLRETLARVAPWLVVAAAYGPGWDLRPDLTNAAEDLHRMRDKGTPNAETYLSQIDAFEPPKSGATERGRSVLRIVAALASRPVKFARFAQRWAQLARQHLEGQGSLFAAEALTPEQALIQAAAAVDVDLTPRAASR